VNTIRISKAEVVRSVSSLGIAEIENNNDGGQSPLPAWELDVLRLLAEGLSNEEIAARLAVLDCTVRSHASRVQAWLYALREGISSLEEEIEPRKGDGRSTLVGPIDISSDVNLIGHPSPVDR
jgi:hypothetical protein